MLGSRLTSFIKVIIGVLLLQVVTTLLVVAALRSDLTETGPLFVLVGALVGFLAALWFSSIYSGTHKLAVSQAREGFSKEREKIRVKAERDKAKLMVSRQKSAGKAAGGGFSGISPKGGMAMVGVLGVGTVLLFSQFVTLGLAALAAVGGSMVGYKVRGLQGNGGRNWFSSTPNDGPEASRILPDAGDAKLIPNAKRVDKKPPRRIAPD